MWSPTFLRQFLRERRLLVRNTLCFLLESSHCPATPCAFRLSLLCSSHSSLRLIRSIWLDCKQRHTLSERNCHYIRSLEGQIDQVQKNWQDDYYWKLESTKRDLHLFRACSICCSWLARQGYPPTRPPARRTPFRAAVALLCTPHSRSALRSGRATALAPRAPASATRAPAAVSPLLPRAPASSNPSGWIE